MLSYSNPKRGGAGGGYYFKYYSEHTDRKAEWFGRGAEILGLGDEVDQTQLNNLLDGFWIDGKTKLVQNAGREHRQGFLDATFSVPKPVSVAWALAAAGDQREFEEAVLAAAKLALAYLEDTTGFSRRGKGGKEIVPAALTFALFFHISSRAEDPQLHVHCLLLNIGVRQDGTTGSLYTQRFFEERMNAGALFQSALANELRIRLGLEIEPARVGFNIKGIPKELCDVFSKRRKEIEALLKERGQSNAKAAAAAALVTRGRKRHTKRPQLLEWWRSVAEAHGFGLEQAKELFAQGRGRRPNQSQQEPRDSWRDNGKEGRDIAPAACWSSINIEKPGEAGHGVETAASIKAFKRELREVTDRVFSENQTRPRILRIAHSLAKKHGVGADKIPDAINGLHLPIRNRFFRIEWKRVFRKAPKWSPFSKFRTPRVVIRSQPRRWGSIHASMSLPGLWFRKEIRIQQRRFFPKAPRWNPLSKLSLPAVRLAPVRPPPIRLTEHDHAR